MQPSLLTDQKQIEFGPTLGSPEEALIRACSCVSDDPPQHEFFDRCTELGVALHFSLVLNTEKRMQQAAIDQVMSGHRPEPA